MMCVCVCEPVRGTGEVCEQEATLQIRPVELLCGASHELPKRVMGPELFLDVPEKGTYLCGHASFSMIGWLAGVIVGHVLW